WSFEEQFRKLNSGAIMHCYDHKLSGRGAVLFSLTQALRTFGAPKEASPGLTWKWWEYYQFFRGKNIHFKERIWRDRSRNSVTIDDVFDRVGGRRRVFLKMDIEGSEY